MPTICVFYGITVRMYYDDHNPPHFHVFMANFPPKSRLTLMKCLPANCPPEY